MNTAFKVPVGTTHQNEGALATAHFNEAKVLQELKHYLPSQTPLKDFIHHNSLHAFQNLKFFDALFKSSKVFGYQVTLQLTEYRELYLIGRIKGDVLERVIREAKGIDNVREWKEKLLAGDYNTSILPRVGLLRETWKTHYKQDLDNQVQPLLFRILCSYLDQGIALWKFPIAEGGFLHSVRELEQRSFASFFKSKRAKAFLRNENCTITELLKIIVGDEGYYEQYLFDQQFSHQGWSGIVCAVEAQPNTLLDRRIISLHDLIVFELLLELDALDVQFGEHWQPLTSMVTAKPVHLLADVSTTELSEVLTLWQTAFEWSYYDDVVVGIKQQKGKEPNLPLPKRFQALFCIDERECSLRRHIEQVDPICETFGTPGFFSVEFYFQPQGGKFYDKLCPAPVTPAYLIKEYGVKEKRKQEVLYSGNTHAFFAGLFSTLTLGFWAGVRLVQNLFRPQMSPAISNAFAHMHQHAQLTIENKGLEDRENNLQVGFTIEEMAARVESLLRGIGLIKDFAPIIYAIAHGSSSANNPHHGAHDCGACSGRPGSVNARVFAFMANHPKVRALLQDR